MKPRSRAPGPLSVAAERQAELSGLGEAATSVRFSWSGSAGMPSSRASTATPNTVVPAAPTWPILRKSGAQSSTEATYAPAATRAVDCTPLFQFY